MPSKSQIGKAGFFTQRPHFSAGLVGKFCLELSTLLINQNVTLIILHQLAPSDTILHHVLDLFIQVAVSFKAKTLQDLS